MERPEVGLVGGQGAVASSSQPIAILSLYIIKLLKRSKGRSAEVKAEGRSEAAHRELKARASYNISKESKSEQI